MKRQTDLVQGIHAGTCGLETVTWAFINTACDVGGMLGGGGGRWGLLLPHLPPHPHFSSAIHLPKHPLHGAGMEPWKQCSLRSLLAWRWEGEGHKGTPSVNTGRCQQNLVHRVWSPGPPLSGTSGVLGLVGMLGMWNGALVLSF
jgi:hypothetical protein